MKLLYSSLFASLAMAVFALPTTADVKVNSLFTENMVLQREMPVPVWGTADAGEEVSVAFGDQTKKTKADDNGNWMVKLDELKANAEGQTLTISGNNKLEIGNVLVGEVWICSGQSNMEWTVGGALQPDVEAANGDYPLIRQIKVPRIPKDTPQTDFPGKWVVASPQTLKSFTAVGFFFGRRLHKELNVPIGLINTSWGGTRIEPWTNLAGFKKVEEQDWATPIIAKLEKGEPFGGNHQQPSKLYNGMIHPLVPYAFRGAIWYQGESNGGEGITYYHKKHALVKGWREVWNQGDFPFYWVQLANFRDDNNQPAGGDGYARVRDAQRKAQDIKNTGMAVIIDIGETKDIHPKNKQDVGARLAQWALANDYGKDIVESGPKFTKQTIEDGKIRLHFDNIGGGLIVGEKNGLQPTAEVKGGTLKRFAIAGEDKVWHWADAVIDGETVVVSSKEVPKPVAVRYAYSGNPLGANLYNREGLPAEPFRTDQW